jgi:PKD repeat protein
MKKIFTIVAFLLYLFISSAAYSQITCQAAFTYQQVTSTLDVNFMDFSLSADSVNSWSWDFGDGDTSTAQNPHHTYAASGSYNVCLTITDTTGCASTLCQNITVAAVSPCNAAFTYVIGPGQTVTFTDISTSTGSSIVSWMWDFGDGDTSSLQNPTHTFGHHTYYVCLTITDGSGCTSTTCHAITMHGNPNHCHASFTFTVDTAGVFTFINTSTGTSASTMYTWVFSDTTSSTLENPTHTFTHYGNFTVCLFVNDTTTGCSSHRCRHVRWSSHVHHYPNPFSHSSFVQYELSEAGMVSIDLMDRYGNRISEISNEMKYPGQYTEEINAADLKTGIYFLRMDVAGQVTYKRISIIK